MLSGFPPILGENPKLLILGTLPGQESLRQKRYYAHPRNAFWPIMQALFNVDINAGYEEKVAQLMFRQIAVWDVLKQGRREGSLDAAIEPNSLIVNDFSALFLQASSSDYCNPMSQLKGVVFNGAMAEKLFLKYVAKSMVKEGVIFLRLPSTSPANARLTLNQKIESWRAILELL